MVFVDDLGENIPVTMTSGFPPPPPPPLPPNMNRRVLDSTHEEEGVPMAAMEGRTVEDAKENPKATTTGAAEERSHRALSYFIPTIFSTLLRCG